MTQYTNSRLTHSPSLQLDASQSVDCNNKSVFSFARQLQTWHCPHLLLRRRAAAAPVVQQSIEISYSRRAHTSKPAARFCIYKGKGKRSIAVRKKPHRYGNSRAIWDHTVLPATRQR